MSFQLNDWYTANFHGLDDSLNQVVLRAAIPFALGDTRHIFRVTQPYVTSSPSGATGFADTTIFDLSNDNCIAFLDPLIESWDIDLATFCIEIVLNRRIAPGRRRHPNLPVM